MPANPTVTEATYPVDFRLLNQQGQGVLYTRLPAQSLDLDLINASRGNLTVAKPDSPDPGPAAADARRKWCDDNHACYVSFRPGTLWTAESLVLAAASAADWQLVRDQWRSDLDGYFLLPARPLTIEVGKKTTLQLQGVQVDGRGGSRSTQVECRYKNVRTSGSDQPLFGNRLNYVAIMDELPSQDPGRPPVQIECVGSNTLLNDGLTPNTLTLRLLNQCCDPTTGKGVPLGLTAASKIILRFPLASDDNPWGVLRDTDSVTCEVLGWMDTSAASRNATGELSRELKFAGFAGAKTTQQSRVAQLRQEAAKLESQYKSDQADPFFKPPGVLCLYRIVSKNFSKCLKVEGNSIFDGAKIVQADSDVASDGNGAWKIETVSGGFFKIVAKNSGKCLKIEGNDSKDGAKIVQADSDVGSDGNGAWKIEAVGGGFFRIVAKNSSKCLKVEGNDSKDGAKIEQADSDVNSDGNGAWKIELLGDAVSLARLALWNEQKL
jgi:hypothetical protein